MRQAIANLKSTSAYSQSRHYTAEKANDGKESPQAFEARTWRERVHADKDGFIYIPPMAFKNCLSEAAKFLSIKLPTGKATYTKHFEAGVLIMEGLTLPIKKDDVAGEWLFVPSDGQRGSGRRVDKCFPLIPEWYGAVTFYVVDETITEKVFMQHIQAAGSFIGIGRFRPRNNGFYGRFSVESLEWK